MQLEGFLLVYLKDRPIGDHSFRVRKILLNIYGIRWGEGGVVQGKYGQKNTLNLS